MKIIIKPFIENVGFLPRILIEAAQSPRCPGQLREVCRSQRLSGSGFIPHRSKLVNARDVDGPAI